MTTTANSAISAQESKTYKGQSIYEAKHNDDIFYIVIGCFTKVFHSLADAKRYIKGEQCKANPLNAKYSEFAMKLVQATKEQYLKDNNLQPSTPTMTEAQYKEIRKDYINSRLALLEQIRERVNEFVADVLKGYGTFKATRIYEDYINISLMDGEKPVFGCDWDVYVRDDVFGKKETKIECNIGTCGSFEIGKDDNQELKYVAFARFITMVKECGLAKYLISTHDKIKGIGEEISKLDDDYKMVQLETL